MRTWLKVVLALGGTLLLGALLVVGAGVWWFRANRDRLAKDGAAARAAGARYGATHQKEECIEEGLREVEGCGLVGFKCEALNNLRLRSCLGVAATGPADVCATAPATSDVMSSVAWLQGECARRGRPGSAACTRLFQTVLGACAKESKPPVPSGS